MNFLQRVSGLSLRDKVRSSDIGGSLGVAAPPHGKELAEVVWAPGQDASWTLPFESVPGTSTWEQNQNMLEGLHISPGLVMP